jgi:hypothetical protein
MGQMEDRIAKAAAKLQQLKAAQQKKEALKRTRVNQRQRQDDTRRKVLIGAAVLARIADGSYTQAKLHLLLDPVISRPEDRALFDLPARPDNTPSDPVT